jgi:RNA polymerase sigma-70 factor (ECF subfamily)
VPGNAATDELLALIRPWLHQLARHHARCAGPDENVSDLVQEAWLRAWQKLDQFSGADDEAQALRMFRAWLAHIVSRLGLNAVRDRGTKERSPPGKLHRLNGVAAPGDSDAVLEPSTGEPTPSAQLQAEEQARRVGEALEQIADPLDRDIVRLRFFEGMSLRQAAEQLGCNHETVRLRYHAALGRLQRVLENYAL